MRTLCLVLLLAVSWPRQSLLAAGRENDPARLDYNLKTTVGAYAAAGVRNPKWDAAVKQTFLIYANMTSGTNGDLSEPTAKMESLLSQAPLTTCNDPLIRYLYDRFVYAGGHSAAESAAMFADTAAALQKSAYPDNRKFFASFRAYKAMSSAKYSQAETASMLDHAISSLAKMLEEKDLPEGEADAACDLLMSSFWWPEADRWTAYTKLEPALTNRWSESGFALRTKGQAYLSYAWKARGTGMANTVSENAFKSMQERLEIAADALDAAWRANPKDPRICLEMLRVELGQGQGRDRLELWFQRGMKLDPSSYDLCSQKLEYLRPRWYGSIKDMVDFGRQCTMNTNWSGSVRLVLADAHNEASQEFWERKDREAYWKQPNVWKDVKFAFDQFFKLYPDEVGYRHNYAWYAAQCGQWQAFGEQIKLFPSTNYAYFGGKERFDSLVRTMEAQTKK